MGSPMPTDAADIGGSPSFDAADSSIESGAVSDLSTDKADDTATPTDSNTEIQDASSGETAAADGAPDTPVGCTPGRWYLDLDQDGFGNDLTAVTACEAAPGYVAQGGDCDDLDPLRYPGPTGDPGFVLDRCGQGRVLEPMGSATGWTAFYSTAEGGLGTMATETGGCRGGGIGFSYDLPNPTTCGLVSCAWVVMRKELPAPVDLHAEDYLLFPFHGALGDPSFQIELKLQDTNGCMLTWALKSATDLPAKRTAVVPLKWFSTPGPGKPCAVDLSAVHAVEIGIKGELAGTGSFAKDTGILHLDAITAVTHSETRMSPSYFACPGPDTGVRSRIAADLLRRHKDSVASRGHPFVASWFEESPSQYWTYNQALLLAMFTLDTLRTGSVEMRAAAAAVAQTLVDLQGQIADGPGRWYDAYKDNPTGTGLVPSGDTVSSWFGNTSWVVIALDLYRDLLAPSPRKPTDDAVALAATWLEAKIAEFQASGKAAGAIHAGTEGNLSTFFALVAAERFARAGAMKAYLLGSPWKADEKRFWAGVDDASLAIDVVGNWGSAFLRAAGENDKALAGLGLAAGVFPARSFDGTHVGLGDIAGPWQPTVEFSGQYIAAGGPGSPYLLGELLAYETNGTFPGSPDDFFGGSGWNTKWHGIAPAAWVYLALSPDILARLSLPLQDYDFESEQGWGMFEELVDPACYVTGAGEVVQSTEYSAAGTSSLRVTANKAKASGKSNHVIGQKKLFSTGQSGTFRLEADAYIPAGVAGQTGPELSLQNTRQAGPGQFTTSTAGIQYVANPADPHAGKWGIWGETSPGVPAWQFPQGVAKTLEAGVWYRITLVVNFDSNRYASLAISDGQASTTFDLSAYRIAPEPNKFTEQAFWVTAEAENMWNNCGAAAATEYRVYYDNIVVRR